MSGLMAECGGCGQVVPEDREPCPSCGAITRRFNRTLAATLRLNAEVQVAAGTPIHLPLMIAAEEARDRCIAAAARGQDELADSMVTVLLAAVALEAAIYWVADDIDPAMRAKLEEVSGLGDKWATLIAMRRTVAKPSLGGGLGQSVAILGKDRNWVAHYPGRGRPRYAAPERADDGRTKVRARFTASRATKAIATASAALEAIGVDWATAGQASGEGQAYDATVRTDKELGR